MVEQNIDKIYECTENDGIDIVIPWVDGNDIAWIHEKQKYERVENGDNRENRYRDWDNLQFLFRGIEKFLPWIRRIHFITWGHIPEWLNTKEPRLHIVNHADYIPQKYLPTFNSHTIEWNMHLISGLSEKFIYCNDDTFFIAPLAERDFFEFGLPKDAAIETVLVFVKDGIGQIIGNDLGVINSRFKKREVIKKHFCKWYSIKYGKKILNNIYYSPIQAFTGFLNPHMPNPFLKSTFEEIWNKESEILDLTCSHKFRNDKDVNQWLARYWQLVNGKFVPGKLRKGNFLIIKENDKEIKDVIENQKNKMICLSDYITDIDFEAEKRFLNSCFEKILPEKCSFEK